ncbi:hypothetical protein ACH5RR_010417 [Cinchona calisaya]|uniref:RIN4 pathogenic type III effector avirulence factor Avr cleavage site domain-containing protein n=1 Tax=Cinchona calisaya TaxID=153742 RepID=A0ABD3AIW4_9GENT
MAARGSVPQFGKWEKEENVPYTLYFDNARKGRGGKMINPNDPQENPDMFPNIAPAHPSPSRNMVQAEEPVGSGSARPQQERRKSREDGKQFLDSPARTDNVGRRTSGESPNHHYGRPTRQSPGSTEHSFERSPIHSHHQAKGTGRGGTSPAWDGKNSYESSHGTHGKSRMKPVNESPDRGAAVPRFGDWEKSPQSADNYTHIFNQIREERHNNVPSNEAGNKSESSYQTTHKQNASGNRKGCCFPWV